MYCPRTTKSLYLRGSHINLLGSYLQGAAALIQNPAILTAAAGILAVEAYHAGSVRLQLIEKSNVLVKAYGVKVNVIVAVSHQTLATKFLRSHENIVAYNICVQIMCDQHSLMNVPYHVSLLRIVFDAGHLQAPCHAIAGC